MKRRILLSLGILSTLVFGGCGNKDMWDTVYRYDYAIVKLDGTTFVEGAVEKWTDYEDGDQIQVQIDGNTYLVHSSNVILMQEGE